MRTFRRLTHSAAIAALAAATLVAAAPASAAINPASYRLVDSVVGFPYPNGAAGGYFFCPPYMKAVAWGATSSGLRDPGITAGFTDASSDRGVFATAIGSIGQQLRMTARCVDDAQLQGSTLTTTLVNHPDPAQPWNHFARTACPTGTVAYGGGHYFNRGGQPASGGFTYASIPDTTGWMVGASSRSSDAPDMVIVAHCLPRSQFGQIVTVRATDTAPADVQPSYPNYPVLFAGAHCPAGFFAYAGGAWLHRFGDSTPTWAGYLTVSDMTYDDQGWFARAWVNTKHAQLTTTVQCMTR
jgi:hypothetical protein